MARVLGIEIAGDYNSAAIKEATAGVETFGRTVNEAATKNIERLAAQRVKLQELAGEYRALAASAQTGSAEQVAALDLAAKAQARLGVEALTTGTKVKAASKEMAVAEGELAKFTRGAAKASGSFGQLGLGLALGSGGFIAGALATGGVKKSIDDAKALMDAQEQLSVAARNVGASLDPKQLDDYLKAESKVSLFTKTDLTASLVGLVRATGSVAKAQQDASLAANIARATGSDLATVTQGLINLEGGRTRSLVALGVKIPIVKTATDALTASGLKFTGQQKAEAAALDRAATAAEGKRILIERYHGASEKFAKSDAAAQDKLRQAENELSTSIGTVLLPVVKQIADPFAKWAQKMADSGRAAKDTKEIVGDLKGVLKDAKGVIEGVDNVTGSFKHTLELLIGLKVVSTLTAWTSSMSLFKKEAAGAAGAGGVGGLLGRLGTLVKLYGPGAVFSAGSGGESGGSGKPFPGAVKDSKGSWVDPKTGHYVAMFGGKPIDMGPDSNWVRGSTNGTTTPSSRGNMRGASSPGSVYSPAQIHDLLMRNGATKHEADFLTAISGREDGTGQIGRLNDNLSTHDYSVGLFQINYRDMHNRWMRGGQAAAAKIAGDPAAQAKYALGLLHSQGPSAWSTNTPAIQSLLNGSGGGGGTLASILSHGTKKPVKPTILRGTGLIGSGLLDAITADKNNATDSSGSIAAMWLHREKADLEKARREVKAKLQGHPSDKQTAAIKAELRTIDTQIAGVNKSITTNLKEQANAIKANAKAAISTAKSNISSAFGQIITDAQSAFSQETQDYIDNVLSAKYLQGTDTHGQGLQTASEKKLADMQAQDTASQLQDALTAAKQQLTDDTTGALLEHVVDITTGATKDIFGPQGTSQQRTLDQKAIDAAQRALDENTIAIDAAKERAQEDYDYAQAVKTYQQQRSLAESAMVHSLNALEKNVEDGKASFTDLQGVLAGFGVSISDIPTDQWTTDFANLGTAVQDLAKVMADEAAALAKIGDGRDAAAAQAAADSISWGTPITAGQQSVVSGLGGAGGYFLLNPIPHAAKGADVLSSGIAMIHKGEQVVPAADVAAYSGGGGGVTIHVNAPNYVGSHSDLAAAIKSPAVIEAVATAVLVGNRRGHIRASQLT